jgi:heme-degrading monooxygenase HmoA
MFAVIFETVPVDAAKDEYLEIAGKLRNCLQDQAGFISIERFQGLTEENKLLSISYWEDEASISKWRNLQEHRQAQKKGKESLFHSYRIRVAEVVRDYTGQEREEAPTDSP